MRAFNYSIIKEQKWDSEVLGLIAAIYREAGKQELYLKQRPEDLKKLVKIAKESKLKVQTQIQGDTVRVTGKSRDDLQAVIQLVRKADLGQPFQFNNFRD